MPWVYIASQPDSAGSTEQWEKIQGGGNRSIELLMVVCGPSHQGWVVSMWESAEQLWQRQRNSSHPNNVGLVPNRSL